ncbi:MAG: hypothetical protein PHQ75_10645, partial [Thermoguttaceae bacterium]|nr:hypothetical protein [Thermoguttaceae bacterium]
FKSDKDSDGNTWIVANLSGPSCPEKWSMLYNYDNVPDYWMGKLSESDNVLNEAHYRIQRTTVKAVIFPHVVDVYSRTFTVSN